MQWVPYPQKDSTSLQSRIDHNPDMTKIESVMAGNSNTHMITPSDNISISVSKIKEVRNIFLVSLMKGIKKMTIDPGVSTSKPKMTKTVNASITKKVRDIMLAEDNISDHNERLAKVGILLTK